MMFVEKVFPETTEFYFRIFVRIVLTSVRTSSDGTNLKLKFAACFFMAYINLA